MWGGHGLNWETDIYTLICLKGITNKNLLYKKINKIKSKKKKALKLSLICYPEDLPSPTLLSASCEFLEPNRNRFPCWVSTIQVTLESPEPANAPFSSYIMCRSVSVNFNVSETKQ